MVMGAFATSCAANAAWGAHGGQRRAWVALAVGLGAPTAGAVLWTHVALGGIAPISNSSVAELGYVVLPLSALTAAVLVPSRDDSRFGIGLLLDGVIVAASVVLAVGSLVLGRADTVRSPRIMLAAVTAFYLGLVVMTLIVVRKVEPGRRLSTGLLSVGFAAIGTAGAIRICTQGSLQVADHVVALGWISGAYFFALSAIAFKPGPDFATASPRRWSRWSMWLPCLPMSVRPSSAVCGGFGPHTAATDMVLTQAVADASQWRNAGTAIRVAINLWARSLDEDPLPDRIMAVLNSYGMPANLLTVEITEELMVADFEKVRAVLNRLRSAGVRVAIDDFGSGYSTLTYLRELPIDEVKLDRQLVAQSSTTSGPRPLHDRSSS